MRWYEGGIAEAVAASKKAGAVFVVYVEGKDSKSEEMSKLINNDEVSQQLEAKHFVAIKIEENSVPHQQFSQIYKQVTVPSLFFIGKTGSPLEIVTEPITIEAFNSTLQKVLQGNGIVLPAGKDTINTFIKTEQTQESFNATSVMKPPEPSTSTEVKENDALSPEEKIERAKELINQKREAKQAEEEEAARLKELERHKVGQDVQKLKRWQQDNELKELLAERNKEKREQQEAKQRVLAQIAQDRAERAARFATAVPQQSSDQSPETSPQPARAATNSSTARLQFKLPDGSTRTHEFAKNDTLQDVRNYIIANLELPFRQFTLSTTFPRREFTNINSQETLVDLHLVPNAVILVLPIHHGAVATNSDSWFLTVFWSFISPILNLVNYLKSKLFGPAQPPAQSDRDQSNPNSTGEPSPIPKKPVAEATLIRRHGNVHRLQDRTDSDDENNTWNGNSTQQM